MSRGLFITATGTDAGKTYVTARIVRQLRAAGYDTGYYKAALSGADETAGLPGDADYVKRFAGLTDSYSEMVPYIYSAAVSPHLAARWEGRPVDLEHVKRGYDAISGKHAYITMEGSGGILCPIRYDDSCHLFLEDIIRALELPSLVVADAGLGTINATLLTLEYMRRRELPVRGIILNRWTGSPMEEDNRRKIEALVGVPVIACLEAGAEELPVSAETLAALYGAGNGGNDV